MRMLTMVVVLLTGKRVIEPVLVVYCCMAMKDCGVRALQGCNKALTGSVVCIVFIWDQTFARLLELPILLGN